MRPKLVTADAIAAPYDAVLLAVKSYSLDAAIEDFAAAVGPRTAIIPTLNGMRHVDVLAERFGEGAVAGGVCKVAATIDPEGRIVQLAAFQELAYGERDGSVSSRMKELDAFMQGAGFAARLSPTIGYEMWEKWTMLATLGAITCSMRGDIGEVLAAPGGSPGSTQSPSMYRDLREGRPIESDQIVGDLLARGGKAGVTTPLLAAAYAHVCVYQQRLAT